jgi:hypothetical protein
VEEEEEDVDVDMVGNEVVGELIVVVVAWSVELKDGNTIG